MKAEGVTALPGNPATITFTESATAGAADHLISAAGEGQSATVNTAVGTNPKVQVVDSYGNAVFGTSIKFTVLTGGGRVGTTLVTSDASGYASTSYKLGTVSGTGNNTMRAEGVTALPGNPATITFTESAVPEMASKLVFTIEPGGVSYAGSALAPQPVVQAQDANGNPSTVGLGSSLMVSARVATTRN